MLSDMSAPRFRCIEGGTVLSLCWSVLNVNGFVRLCCTWNLLLHKLGAKATGY